MMIQIAKLLIIYADPCYDNKGAVKYLTMSDVQIRGMPIE